MLLSRSTLFAALYSCTLHIILLGMAAATLVTPGRSQSPVLKVTLFQLAVPLPVGASEVSGVKVPEPVPAPVAAPQPPPPSHSRPKPKKQPAQTARLAPRVPQELSPPLTPPTPSSLSGRETDGAEAGADRESTAGNGREGAGGNGRRTDVGAGGGSGHGGNGGELTQPQYRLNPKPPYPVVARRMGQQGVVMLRVRVRPDGSVAEAELVQSSGSALLDESALRTVRESWRFVPAHRDGTAVESWVQVPIRFVLETS